MDAVVLAGAIRALRLDCPGQVLLFTNLLRPDNAGSVPMGPGSGRDETIGSGVIRRIPVRFSEGNRSSERTQTRRLGQDLREPFPDLPGVRASRAEWLAFPSYLAWVESQFCQALASLGIGSFPRDLINNVEHKVVNEFVCVFSCSLHPFSAGHAVGQLLLFGDELQ